MKTLLKKTLIPVLAIFLFTTTAPAFAGHGGGHRHGGGGNVSRPQRSEHRSSGGGNVSRPQRSEHRSSGSANISRPQRSNDNGGGSNSLRSERIRRPERGNNGSNFSRPQRSNDNGGRVNGLRSERIRRPEHGNNSGGRVNNNNRSSRFIRPEHHRDSGNLHRRQSGPREIRHRGPERRVVHHHRPVVTHVHYHRYHRPHYRYHYTYRTYRYYCREREELAAMTGFASGLLLASILQNNTSGSAPAVYAPSPEGSAAYESERSALLKELNNIAESEITYLLDAIKNIGSEEALLAIEDEWKKKNIPVEYRPGNPRSMLRVSNVEGISLIYGIDTMQGVAVVEVEDQRYHIKESRSAQYEDPADIAYNPQVIGFDITESSRTPDGYLRVVSVDRNILPTVDGIKRGTVIYSVDGRDTATAQCDEIYAYLADKASQKQAVILEIEINGLRTPLRLQW